jgi:DNA-binding transcriptional LysR family regulator
VHQAPTTEAVVGIVACGEGVAILPASAERLRMRGVSFRPLNLGSAPEALGSVRFGLAWRRGMETPIIRRFLEHVESDPALPWRDSRCRTCSCADRTLSRALYFYIKV